MTERTDDAQTLQSLSRRTIRWVALGLFVVSFLLLWVTQDMGFTRDESFYFGYGESYQAWFIGAERAKDREARSKALGRKATLRTWKGNFEHPPLMKVLFGWSWRALARHDRNLLVPRPPTRPGQQPGKLYVTAMIGGDGFAEGDQVELLAPLYTGQNANDDERTLGTATIVKRSGNRAELKLDEGLTETELAERCKPRAGDQDGEGEASRVVIASCQARDLGNWPIMSESEAMRLPGIVSGALAVVLTFLLGVELFNWLVGLFGALIFFFVPRTFFHAHLTCFDMPIVAATLATLYAFWRSRDDRRWALGAGVFWGLALMTKHNAFFLAVPLVAFWLWCGRHEARLGLRGWRPMIQLPSIPLALLVMPVVAFPMLYVFWPRLWYDAYFGISEYFVFHLEHVHYFQWYFGQPLEVPPFPVEFPWALTWYTVPEAFLWLFFVGLVFALPVWRARQWFAGFRKRVPPNRHERAMAYAVLGGAVPIILISLPNVPIFGGVKHWMTGMPLLSLVAGYGLYRCLVLALGRWPTGGWRLATAAAVVGVIFIEPVSASVRSSAYGTGYYNSLAAGGIQGAADRQMMRMYWGHTTRQALDWINLNAPRNARIFWQNTTWGSFRYYQREGWLRQDIRYHNGFGGADMALIEPQKSFQNLDNDTRRSFKAVGPLWTVDYEGVPMLRVYVRKKHLMPKATPPKSAKPKATKPKAATPRPSRRTKAAAPKARTPKSPSRQKVVVPGPTRSKPVAPKSKATVPRPVKPASGARTRPVPPPRSGR